MTVSDFDVPQVGILEDVKGLPWIYRDFDRWTSAQQRDWALSWLRVWLPTQPWVRSWNIREGKHNGTSTLELPDPFLILALYSKPKGMWIEGSTFFTRDARIDQVAFVAKLQGIADPLALAGA